MSKTIDIADFRKQGGTIDALMESSEPMQVDPEKVKAEVIQLERRLRHLRETQRAAAPVYKSIADVGGGAWKRLNDTRAGLAPEMAISTQWHEFNKLSGGGWMRDNISVIAARPKQGKTSILEAEALYHGARNRGVIICPVELTAEMMVIRMGLRESGLCRLGIDGIYRLPPTDRRAFDEYENNVSKFMAALIRVRAMPIVFAVPPGAKTWANYQASCDRILEEWPWDDAPCEIVALDHLARLNLNDVRKRTGTKADALSEVTREMGDWIQGSNMAFILVHQLNRDSSKAGIAPRLENLKDSGSVEESCSVCVMPHRPSASGHSKQQLGTCPDDSTGEMCLWVVTGTRFGEGGQMNMFWSLKNLSFQQRFEGSVKDQWMP